MDIGSATPDELRGRHDLTWARHLRDHLRSQAAIVAEADSEVLGIVSWRESSLHQSRLWLTVDVHPHHRREGIASALIAQALRLRPSDRPFAVKAAAGSVTAALFESMGARPYQSCPPAIVVAQRSALAVRPDMELGSTLRIDTLVDAFVDMYEWVHQPWSPISSRQRAREIFEPDLATSLDLALSSFVVDEDRKILAGAWVFRPETSGKPLEGVAESTTPTLVQGVSLVDAAVRNSLSLAAMRGERAIQFDCHDSDPHMREVMGGLSGVSGTQTLLFELD